MKFVNSKKIKNGERYWGIRAIELREEDIVATSLYDFMMFDDCNKNQMPHTVKTILKSRGGKK